MNTENNTIRYKEVRDCILYFETLKQHMAYYGENTEYIDMAISALRLYERVIYFPDEDMEEIVKEVVKETVQETVKEAVRANVAESGTELPDFLMCPSRGETDDVPF